MIYIGCVGFYIHAHLLTSLVERVVVQQKVTEEQIMSFLLIMKYKY